MKKLFQIQIIISIIVLFLISCVEPEQQPVDWRPTFDSSDRIPFGTYILKKELGRIFPSSNIQIIRENTGFYFEENSWSYDYEDEAYYDISGTYFFIYPYNFHTNKTWAKIINFVEEGNSAFISNRELSDSITNVLGVKIDTLEFNNVQSSWVKLSTRQPEHYTNEPISMEKGMQPTYFSAFDVTRTEVLGDVEYNGKEAPNFLRVAMGDGYIYLHSEPYAFTNYHMLKEDHYQYINQCFSYIETYDIHWDNHNIQYKQYNGEQKGGFFDSLSFVFKHKQLSWAFLTLLAMAVLYLLFNYKRKQRAVKVLHPYENYSLDFAKTISLLYQRSNNQKALANQKINYFLDAIRTKYHLQTNQMDDSFSELLSEKSNVPLKECKGLVFIIQQIKNASSIEKQQFYTLHKKIETFSRKSNLYGTIKSR